MKTKDHFYHIHFALFGIPFLLMSPAAQAQDKDEKLAEVTEAELTEQEKGKARSAKEAAGRGKETAKHAKERAREAVERAKEAARHGKETAERAKEAAKRSEQADETEKAEEGNENAQGAKAAANAARERADEAAVRAQEAAEHAGETAGRAKEAADHAEEVAVTEEADESKDDARRVKEAAKAEKERAKETGELGKERAELAREAAARRKSEQVDEDIPEKPPEVASDPNTDKPVLPSERPKTREDIKSQADDSVPTKEETAELASDDVSAENEIVEIPSTEPERLAETEVADVTREVSRELERRKTRIEGENEARALVEEILGAESRISQAEISREEQFRPRIERQREARQYEVSPDQRRAATTYYQQRLRGREVEGPAPKFFRRSESFRDGSSPRVRQRDAERVELVRPRYMNDGRRYVHYDSRASIPAILMAAQAMNQVRFQPTREIAPMFYERQEVSAPHAMPLPPESYRNEDSWVVSYPVDENSMISSEDILFLQGSTQFSDPYSYEVVGVMADAMKAMPEAERFVIEGHASAEGSYDSNMALSQQRAEYIVREIVRRGVSPYRLLPVGYGESEARHPADAAEFRRSQDRRVVVFRMKPEAVARR